MPRGPVVITLVVPHLDDIIIMVLLISALGNIKIGATKPIFLDLGFLKGALCVRGHGLLSLYSSYITLNSSKKPYFLCL